ncbi:MAG: GatB/YqeY domain-containing protein [Candidatus Saccharibacteria bacterium]|nr:GatB/YqeY domain-containing protein [Candidatus Saccharibacteria bacterium]
MTIKQQLEVDIKNAMLAGDKVLVTTLRGLKSVILYAEVASGEREKGLSDEVVTSLLQKESKKRVESSELYRQGGNTAMADAEDLEKTIIDGYLPEQMSEADIALEVDKEFKNRSAPTIKDLGQVIGAVKKACGSNADSAIIARLVKERLQG